jgi:peptidoglycan hydrolase CwlO-like protein
MLKLKEKEMINSELEYELTEISDTINNFNRKIKECEERNSEIEREIKSLKK